MLLRLSYSVPLGLPVPAPETRVFLLDQTAKHAQGQCSGHSAHQEIAPATNGVAGLFQGYGMPRYMPLRATLFSRDPAHRLGFEVICLLRRRANQRCRKVNSSTAWFRPASQQPSSRQSFLSAPLLLLMFWDVWTYRYSLLSVVVSCFNCSTCAVMDSCTYHFSWIHTCL